MRLKNIEIIWDSFELNSFYSSPLDKNIFVYKLANASNATASVVLATQFFTIVKVASGSMTTPVGFAFLGNTLELVSYRVTTRAIAGSFPTTFDKIKNCSRTRLWQYNKLELLNFSNYGEVITDLAHIMGVSLLS
jgi:hypothetical protein